MSEELTLSEARNLKVGQLVYEKNNIEQPLTITSVKTWKRYPNRIRIRLKRGNKYYEVTEEDLCELSLH